MLYPKSLDTWLITRIKVFF